MLREVARVRAKMRPLGELLRKDIAEKALGRVADIVVISYFRLHARDYFISID